MLQLAPMSSGVTVPDPDARLDDPPAPTPEGGEPVHIVQDGETLFSICT